MAEKKCSKCGEIKPLSDFYRRADAKDGLSHWCKSCMDAKRKAHAAANPDRERQMRREWAQRNPEKVKASADKKRATQRNQEYMRVYGPAWYAKNKKRKLAVGKAWRAANLELLNTKARAYYYANKAAMLAYNKAWAQSHRERMRAYTATSEAKRRAAKRGSKGTWTEKDISILFELQCGMCAACRCKLNKSFHRDHIVALAAGGSNDKLNLQLLCKSCNSQKHKKDPIRFMQERGYLL